MLWAAKHMLERRDFLEVRWGVEKERHNAGVTSVESQLSVYEFRAAFRASHTVMNGDTVEAIMYSFLNWDRHGAVWAKQGNVSLQFKQK